jgi:hypothetical protein
MKKTPEQENYEKVMLPALLELREKAIELGFPFLFAVQVKEQIRIVGDTTGAPDTRLNRASSLLFEGE